MRPIDGGNAGMVIARETKMLCDVCGKPSDRRARIGWVGDTTRTVDLCDTHSAPVDDLLASIQPARRSIRHLPVVALPDGPAPNTPITPPETGLSREKATAVGDGKGTTVKARRSKKPAEG